MTRRYDLCLVIGNGDDRGQIIDRIDNFQEDDLFNWVGRMELAEDIKQLFRVAKALEQE